MGRDQQKIKLSREAMRVLAEAKIKKDRDAYISALVLDTVPQLDELRDLRYAAEALSTFLTQSGFSIDKRPEDDQWQWRQQLTEQARNGQREIERHSGGYASKWLAQASALRRLDEDYSAWRASQDIESL